MLLLERDGFTLDGGVCYYVSPEPQIERETWKQSRQYCTERQSDLIVINSKGKQVCVYVCVCVCVRVRACVRACVRVRNSRLCSTPVLGHGDKGNAKKASLDQLWTLN